MNVLIGCAGWNLPKDVPASFPAPGTQLQRYARRFNAVEINSSFYRPHRISTYQRWADSTPGSFRFAVELPKQVTHVSRLVGAGEAMARFIDETSGLREKLGAILIQLPPSLAFEPPIVEPFFRELRARTDAAVVCEPRHATWFTAAADALLSGFAIDRVAADPSVVPDAAEPGGIGLNPYFRWHGSPRMYYSAYDDQALRGLASRLLLQAQPFQTAWCIFDNTALGAAVENAMALGELVKKGELAGALP